jgi:WD40 repeat protein/tRNA A-37 threonylcarbamoyl transferase component Bud32
VDACIKNESCLDSTQLWLDVDRECDRFRANPPPEGLPNVPGLEILSELGQGGMGIVYKARQTHLNRLCALKITLPGQHASDVFRARFLAEAETIARLRHPNIVQIYGLGEHEGRPYFVMEYIEGGSLAGRLDGTPWAPGPAARMIAVLARAIADVHRLGIVHRDLKPANVLLTDDETPKVVDFGLAKSLEGDTNLTQPGIFVGTPSYAAPEQVEGVSGMVGPAVDIYALGAIFYHMLTGRPPFQAATIFQTLEQVRSVDVVPPSRLQPGLPCDAETICLKCLEKNPHRRYADATDLAEDLDRFLAGRAILARPTPAVERFGKWVRRRPAVAMLSAAVVGVTVLGFILVSWQWRRAEAKAALEAAANQRAQQARLVAFEQQAQLTLHQALALCDQGEIGRGLLWLARSLERVTEAKSDGLDRPIRINLADWVSQLIRPLNRAPMRHSSPILILSFRRQGRELVSVGRDGAVHAWETATGKEIEPQRWHWWDMETYSPIIEALILSLSPNTPWALSADGRTLVTGGRDRRVIRRDVTGRRLLERELHLDSPVNVIAVSPDGRTVITGRQAGRLHVWNLDTGRGFDLPPQGTEVTSLVFSPDGRVFASATEGGVVRLWDALLLGPIGQSCKLVSAITSLAFDPTGRVLAIGGDDGTIRLWEAPRTKAMGRPVRVNSPVQTMMFGKHGERLLIGTAEGALWWDLKGQSVHELNPGERERLDDRSASGADATTVSPDTRILASTSRVRVAGRISGRLVLRDAATGRYLRQSPDQLHVLSGVAFSPDSKRILTWGLGPRSAQLWDVATLRDPQPCFKSLDSPINQVVFGRDGRSLLVGCRDGRARLWVLDGDVEVPSDRCPRHAYPITAVAFDPKRSRVVTGCHAGTVRVWDATRGTMLSELRQNAGEIVVLAFSPDGNMLVTASRDGTARFLDAASGTQLGPTLHHTDAVLCVMFHPDGQSVLTGTRDGLVQRWHVPCPPRSGAVPEVRSWVTGQTGMDLDDQGAVTMGSNCE